MKALRMQEHPGVKLPTGTLIRYWYSPRGNLALNLGGWRMGRLVSTGRVWYVIESLDAEENRRKFRITFTRVRDAEEIGNASPK